ncbi:MAG: hypothetical protein ABH952_00390 [Candidatus Omnitrophota bacterium]
MMKRYYLIYPCLIAVVFLFLAGCITTKKNPTMYQSVSTEEQLEIKEWRHAADLAVDVNDYSLAKEYYSRIVTLYPGTKYAEQAGKKLDLIKSK